MLVALIDFCILFTQEVCSNSGTRTESLEIKGLVVVATPFRYLLVPKTVGIVAVEGQHRTVWYGRAQFRPSCSRIERQVETYFQSYLLEGHQVFATASIFVVELGSDNGTTVLPLQTLHLRKNLAIEFLSESKKHAVCLAKPAAFGKQPVRNTTITHLAMTERAQTQYDRHLFLFADL